ncbi:chromosome partitioning protein, ParB family [Desulfonauticus submarinus]|uniref:Chromosome partitioning protein, ParB family n=1 Tax=Desulfonauticus submarinus TaxID=206665 RepID=A0A1H0EQE3_9BACT|nr:ParB/RepB/Spo0J family partition protein [Desulfonauticus submarinus]SDN84592.1 chromosome partitioning protein, ParB family [Desulfonauticus submarinus]
MNKKGLGKGIDALLGDWRESSKDLEIIFLDLTLISPNPKQPRQNFNSESLQELAKSIKSEGVLQPILVRPVGDRYEIVAGERRFRASQLVGLEKIPAIVKNLEDKEALLLALIENIHREDLNPIEQARALSKLKEEFQLSQEELAQKVNLSRSQVANLLRLLSLPEHIQKLIEAGKLSAGHGRTLASIKDPIQLEQLVQEILNKNLSVREIESKAKRIKNSCKKTLDDLLSFLEKSISQKLEIKAKCKGSRKKGKIILEYSNEDELKKLLKIFSIENH